MSVGSKGRSPFYPGQPVPVELFVGRKAQIDRILTRGVAQVAAGKPVAMFLQGEYGIGKSSIANYVQRAAERSSGLHAIYAPLGGIHAVEDIGGVVLEATVRSGAFEPSRGERVRSFLAKYIGEQSLFGLTVRADALRQDGPTVSKGLLPFLENVVERLAPEGVRGIFLVLDEVNGISSQPDFAHFIKALVDSNALRPKPLPLLLMLCGVEERRREMIQCHPPVDRIFDIMQIETMSEEEMQRFFEQAFQSVNVRVEEDAMPVLTKFAAGFPKIMHLLGDAAFWLDDDGIISKKDAYGAVAAAAEEVGQKYVEQQVFRAIRSKDYRSILDKIAATGMDPTFRRAEIAEGLAESERRKLDNFLARMKELKVIRAGDVNGEYVFNVLMVRIYIWLEAQRRREGAPKTED